MTQTAIFEKNKVKFFYNIMLRSLIEFIKLCYTILIMIGINAQF
jgi:hypothetical protein